MLGGAAAAGAAGGAGWGLLRRSFGADPSGEHLARISQSPNCRDGAFRNLVEVPEMTANRPRRQVMWEFLTEPDHGQKPTKPVPSRKTPLFGLADDAMVWLGHSGYFLRAAGLSILIDPALHHASPVPFSFAPFPGSNPYSPADLPEIDLLVITHDHYDHLDVDTVDALKGRVKRVVCPLGVGSHFAYWGWPPELVAELDWFDEIDVGACLKVTAVPSQHFSGRTMKRNTTLWAGFVFEIDGRVLYLSGDGGYGPHFKAVKARWPVIDLAILEAGQYSADWSTIHLMPNDWRQAAADLAPQTIAACHNSKYDLSRHLWTDPLNAALENARRLNLALAAPMIGEAFIWHAPDCIDRQWWPDEP